jgi:Mg-chelatase subunit ChlD
MTEISKAELSEYNFTVLVDRSGSMAGEHSPGVSRWQKAETIAKEVADFTANVDDNGIEVIVFGGQFNANTDVFKGVTSAKVHDVFLATQPSGSTPLAEALNAALDLHFAQTKKGFFVVITDGMPNDQAAVMQTIIGASSKLNAKKDLSILFLQVGYDTEASTFLRMLDDDLKGAKFDIVDTKTAQQYHDLHFEQLFYQAQND